MTTTTARARTWAWVGLATMVMLAVALHVNAGLVFPRPWPDESHFLTPALTLVADARLAVPELNAPDGLFWMPAGYYLTVAPLLALGVEPLAAGRALSLIGICGFAVAIAAVARRTGVPEPIALLLPAAWLCMPRVVAAGNIARMEAVILAVVGLALWLIVIDRWWAAVAVAALGPLIHPTGVVVLIVVLSSGLVRAPGVPTARWERLLLGLVAVLWLAQVGYLVAHAEAVRDHLTFQFTRKTRRGLRLGLWAAAAIPVTAIVGGVATIRWWRASARHTGLWTCVAVAGALVMTEVVGREVWYGVLGRETAVVLVGVALVGAVPPRWWRLRPVVPGLLAALLLAGAGGLVWTLDHGWFRMRPDVQATAEWRTFVADATAQLESLDRSIGAPAVVLVDPISGFGQELVGRPWQRLTFVQPTPATPRSPATADYVLITPGAPFVTRSLATTWGEQPPARVVGSPRRHFRLELYANPD